MIYILVKRILILVLICCTILPGFGQKKLFKLEDFNRLVSLSSINISPDGTFVLFITSRRDLEKNQFIQSLILMDFKSKEQKEIGKDLNGISDPAWRSDGMITLLAQSEKGKQVYLLDPQSEETSIVANIDQSVLRYAWSPDGKKLAYFVKSEHEPDPGSNPFNNAFEVGSYDMFTDKPTMNTEVWMLSKKDERAYKITPEDFTVATGLVTSSLSWSSDGNMLAFTKYPSAASGDSDLGKNYIYQVLDGNLTPATQNQGNESSPIFDPTGQNLIYRFPRDGFASNIADWYEVDLKFNETRNITRKLDRSIYDIKWCQKDIMLLRGIGQDKFAIWKPSVGQHAQLELGDLTSISSWSVAENGSMVLIANKGDAANEVYFKPDFESEPIQLTHFNSFVDDIELGHQDVVAWESSDDLRPNGILTFPPGFDRSNKYPLVLYIHGGPSAASLKGFSPIPQAMAAKGWIVFQPNYRGSTNLGNEFQSAISKDPSEGPGQDVINGINLLKQRSYIDGEKICVSGWSYGGWMTAWLIGRYPDLWAAAVAGAAPVDFTDMYSLNDLNRMRRHAIIESPYMGNNLQWAYENSPIFNFSKISTPTLIMSKTEDSRVTVTGSYKLYGALRDNNVPAQFIAYPGPGHFPSDPVRSLDVYSRWIDWLDKYLSLERKN